MKYEFGTLEFASIFGQLIHNAGIDMISKKVVRTCLFQPLTLIVLLTIIQLFVALLSNNLTFTHEEAMWEYIGRNWFRNGLIPYNGGIDNKSPLIFAVFGLSDKLFGVNFWFPRILGTVCQSFGLFFLYKTAEHIAGKQAGIFAVTLYGLSLLWKGTGGAYVSFTETYTVTFIVVSFYKHITAARGKDYFISGLFAGLAFGVRISAIFGIIAILISVLRRNFTYTILFLIGVLLSVTMLVSLLTFAGIHLHDFLTYGFIDNFGSGSPTDYDFFSRLERAFDSFFYSELILFYPLVIGYFIIKKKLDGVTIWMICEFIGINVLGIYARNHFKELLPSLSLSSGIFLAYLIEVYKIPVKPVIIILWITFFPKILEPLVGLKKLVSSSNINAESYCQQFKTDDNAEKALGLWIKAHTTEGQKVYVAGFGARVQAYSERQSPAIYFNVTQTKMAKERLFHDLLINQPSIIAVPVFPDYTKYVNEDIRSFINNLVINHYSFQRCLYGYNIYDLK